MKMNLDILQSCGFIIDRVLFSKMQFEDMYGENAEIFAEQYLNDFLEHQLLEMGNDFTLMSTKSYWVSGRSWIINDSKMPSSKEDIRQELEDIHGISATDAYYCIINYTLHHSYIYGELNITLLFGKVSDKDDVYFCLAILSNQDGGYNGLEKYEANIQNILYILHN